MKDIKFINLIHYFINLIVDIRSIYQSIKRYIFKKKKLRYQDFFKDEKNRNNYENYQRLKCKESIFAQKKEI